MTHRLTVIVTAAGTAAGWHLIDVARQYFGTRLRIVACDAQPHHLVAAAVHADSFVQVPLTANPAYRSTLLELLARESADVLATMHELDVYAFPSDDPELQRLNVLGTGIPKRTIDLLQSKVRLAMHLRMCGISVPATPSDVDISSAPADSRFFAKPASGFGSLGARTVASSEAAHLLAEGQYLVQELCAPPEVTVEVFNVAGDVRALCRERLEVKAGVCTKARIWHDMALEQMARDLATAMDLPAAFCFQVMRLADGSWAVIDVNPRLGAGTALCTRAGWSLAAAGLSTWIGEGELATRFLQTPAQPTYVVRVYEEILMPTPGTGSM